MKFSLTTLHFTTVLVASAGLCVSAASAQSLKCETGPVEKTYGAGQWLVYSCDDTKSIVAVTAPGNPAMPFYFMLSPLGGTYKLEGEGTGNKAATASAFDQLKKLSGDDIAALIKETQMVRNAPRR